MATWEAWQVHCHGNVGGMCKCTDMAKQPSLAQLFLNLFIIQQPAESRSVIGCAV